VSHIKPRRIGLSCLCARVGRRLGQTLAADALQDWRMLQAAGARHPPAALANQSVGGCPPKDWWMVRAADARQPPTEGLVEGAGG
jgi:hypothetical protein